VADMNIGEYYNIYVLNEIEEALGRFYEDELLKFKFFAREGYCRRWFG